MNPVAMTILGMKNGWAEDWTIDLLFSSLQYTTNWAIKAHHVIASPFLKHQLFIEQQKFQTVQSENQST